MALGVLYQGSLVSLANGHTVWTKVWKDGAVSPVTKRIAHDGVVLMPQGPSDTYRYEPILATTAELRYFDPDGLIAAEMATASDTSHILDFGRNAEVWFYGYILPDPVDTHLASFPGQIVLQGTDGLPKLDDTAFVDANDEAYTDPMSPLAAICRCLELIGLPLNLVIRSNLYTDWMNTTDDPTAQVVLPGETWTDEEGAPLSAGDVLHTMLTAHHLTLRQSRGKWYAIDYDLLFDATTITTYTYNLSAVRQSSQSEDLRVLVTQSEFDDNLSLVEAKRSFHPGLHGVTVAHDHGLFPSLIRNSAFDGQLDRRNFYRTRPVRGTGSGGRGRDFGRSIVPGTWSNPAFGLKDGYWTDQDGNSIIVRIGAGPGGENAVQLDRTPGRFYHPDFPTNILTKWVQQAGLVVTGGTDRRLFITTSVKVEMDADWNTPIVYPCHFEVKLLGVGPSAGQEYWLNLDGEFVGAAAYLNYQHQMKTDDGVPFWGAMSDRWVTLSLASTQDIPAGTWQAFIRLYQAPDILYIPAGIGDERWTIWKTLWTLIYMDVLVDGYVPSGTYIGASAANGNTLTRTYGVLSGDIPVRDMRGSYYNENTGAGAGDWKRGTAGTGSGRSHGEVLAEILFREQESNVDLLRLPAIHPDLDTPAPHEVWVVDGVRYTVGETVYNLCTEIVSGRFHKIEQSGTPVYGEFQPRGSRFAATGGQGTSIMSVAQGTLNTLLSDAIGYTTSTLYPNPTLDTIPIDALTTSMETGEGIFVVSPQGEYYEMTLAQNAGQGATSLTVSPYNLTTHVPAGAGIFPRTDDIKTLLILVREAFRVSLRSGALATLSADVGPGTITSLPVATTLTRYKLRHGQSLEIKRASDGTSQFVLVDGSAYSDGIVPEGLTAIPIQSQVVTAYEGDAVDMDGKTFQTDIIANADELLLRVLSSEMIATWTSTQKQHLTSTTAPTTASPNLTVEPLPRDVPDGTKVVLEYQRDKDPVDGTAFFDQIEAEVNGSHVQGATTLVLTAAVTVPVDTQVIVTMETIFARFDTAESRIQVVEDGITAEVSRYESDKIADIAGTYAGSVSSIQIENLQRDIAKGDKFIVTRMADGARTEIEAANSRTAGAGPFALSIVTNTVYANSGDPLKPGVLSQLRIELDGIVTQTNAFRTNAWNGTVNDSGQITAFASDQATVGAGWSFGKAGHFEFAGSDTDYFRWNGGNFEFGGNIVAEGGTLKTLDVAGTITVGAGGSVQSDNYVADTSGWLIDNTSAEFNDVTIRGTLYYEAGAIEGVVTWGAGGQIAWGTNVINSNGLDFLTAYASFGGYVQDPSNGTLILGDGSILSAEDWTTTGNIEANNVTVNGALNYATGASIVLTDANPDYDVTLSALGGLVVDAENETVTVSDTVKVSTAGAGYVEVYSSGVRFFDGTTTHTFEWAWTGLANGQILYRSGGKWINASLATAGIAAASHVHSAADITTGTLDVARGGTGQTGVPAQGQLLIGNGSTFTRSTLQGSGGIGITNGVGSITVYIAAETFAPFTHTHGTGDITGLSAAIDAQIDTTQTVTSVWTWETPGGANASYFGVRELVNYHGFTLRWRNGENAVNFTPLIANTLDGTKDFGFNFTTSRWYFDATPYVGSNAILDASSSLAWAKLTGVPSTFTPSAHVHAASDITTGILSVGRGGTGQSTAPTDGQILVGTAGVWAATTLGGTNGISISAGAGSLSIGITPGTYADASHNHDATYLKLIGGTLTGDLHMGSNQITGTFGIDTADLIAAVSGRTDVGNALGVTRLNSLADPQTRIAGTTYTLLHTGSTIDADTLGGQAGAYYLAWANITGKPSTFAPSAHTHAASEITDFNTAVDARLDTAQTISGVWTWEIAGGANASYFGVREITGYNGFTLRWRNSENAVNFTPLINNALDASKDFGFDFDTTRWYFDASPYVGNNAILDASWTGSTSVTTVGTIAAGTWQGTPIASAYLGAHTHAVGDITGVLPVSKGGTNSSAAIGQGQILVGFDGSAVPVSLGGTGGIVINAAAGSLSVGIPSNTFAAYSHNHDGTYAPVSHAHAASDITSGVLSIGRGGTGQSAVPSDGQVALGTSGVYYPVTIAGSGGISISAGAGFMTISIPASTFALYGHDHAGVYAPVSHSHAASDITSGVLSVGRGGTGQSTVPTDGQILVGTSGVWAAVTMAGSGGISISAGAGFLTVTIPSNTFAAYSHAHVAGDITSGTFADARIAQSNVTQHQAALSIGWGQVTSKPTLSKIITFNASSLTLTPGSAFGDVGGERTRVDLSEFATYRLCITVVSGTAKDHEFFVQYSTDGSTWYTLTSTLTASSTGVNSIGFLSIPAGAQGDVYVRMEVRDATVLGSCEYGIMQLEVKS